MPARRLIVIDADLNKRLATELKYRGRSAVSLSSLQLHRSLDPVVLQRLAERLREPWVLVTGDDNMPADHAGLITDLTATIATVDPRRPSEMSPDAYRREVVHRWAHVMADQPTGLVRRYSLTGYRTWRHRRRR